MATYKPYRKTSSGKEEIKIPYSVLSNPPAIPTSINGLTGGTVNGNITLTKQLVFNDTSNPFIQMQSGGNTYYFQAYDGKFGLGVSWGKATKFDENGNVEFAARPKVGTASVALQSDIPAIPDVSGKANLAGGNTFSGTQVINGFLDIRGTAADKHLKTRGIGGSDGNGISADLYLQYSSDFKTVFGKTGNSSLNADGSVTIGGKKAATTDQIPDISGKQDKLTAGSNISISGNTISATDTGMVGIDVVGGGNAITGASYSASTRLLTLAKGATYATTSQIPTKTSDLTNDSNFVKSNAGVFTGNVTADNFNSRFSLQSVPYGTAVGANADLNTTTYLKVGNYYCSADNTVATQTNVPTNRAYMMTVYSPLGTHNIDQEATATWVYRVRKLMTYTGDEYIQYVYSGGTAGSFTYNGWQQIAHKSDIPTFSLVGTTLTITA